jgi:hypothetical protein
MSNHLSNCLLMNKEINKSEVYAFLACSEYCISEGIVNRAVSICSDSRAALLALKSHAVSSRVVLQYRDSLQELALSNRVRLVCVTGHCGIHGNEEANAKHLQQRVQVLLLWGRSLVQA